MLGNHAFMIIGYGIEGGLNYWLCINSWTEAWGDHGLFKIKMGELSRLIMMPIFVMQITILLIAANLIKKFKIHI